MTAKMSSLKNPVRSSWIRELGCRLDAPPFVSGALEAKKTIESLRVRKDCVEQVVASGNRGVFHAGRVTRQWVTDPAFGTKFLSGTDIFQNDLSNLALISNKVVRSNEKLLVQSGWILITRSGTVGRTMYARPDMDGFALTEDVLRVVPDSSRIQPGYLYAFLASKFGVPVVISGTYGSIIQHLEPEHILPIAVPRFGKILEDRVHLHVDEAAQKRCEASQLIATSIRLFHQKLSLPLPVAWTAHRRPFVSRTTSRQLVSRMDGYYFCYPNLEAATAFLSIETRKRLEEVTDVFIPGIFKRRYGDGPDHGIPYITGADIFTMAPTSEKFLLRSVANQYDLVLHKGMIVIQEAGQVSGLIGRAVLVGEYLDGFACSNNMVRISPYETTDAGYIFAVLSSEFGVRLVKRESSGSSIPHLERNRVAKIEIPWPNSRTRQEIGAGIEEAIRLRDQANVAEMSAVALVEQAIEENA